MSESMGLRPHQIVGYENVHNNLLANPGFDIWQRGTSFTSGTQQFTADEWRANGTSGVWAISRGSSPLFGDYALSLDTYTHTSGQMAIQQGIERYKDLEGQWITFSVWAKCAVAGALRVLLYDYDGSSETATSTDHPGDNQWHQLTVVKQVRSGLTSYGIWPHNFGLVAEVNITESVTNVLVDGAFLVVGNFPEGVAYSPLSPAQDWARCQRFYETGTVASAGSTDTSLTSTGNTVGFNTRKYSSPTVAYSTFFSVRIGTPIIWYITPEGFTAQANSTSATGGFAWHFTWTAEVS